MDAEERIRQILIHIKEKKGAYSRDNLTHAENIMEKSSELAIEGLQILADCSFKEHPQVDMEKRRELLKLRKTRPKIKTDESFDGIVHAFYDRTEVAQWFKKFGELTEEEKLKEIEK